MTSADSGGTTGSVSFEQTSHDVVVGVTPVFLESHSEPAMAHFVWAYRVRIGNQRDTPVRLLNRYWRIADSGGGVQEVRGEGVVGEQPLIQPGAVYEYTSGAPLATPSGFMSGSYEMETPEGERFDVAIPAFSLDSPHEKRRAN